jgi:hypothetical protein
LDRFAPDNARIVALQPVRAGGMTPPEVAIVWEPHGQFPDTGFSLWKARNTFGQGHSTYDAYRHWQLAYNWRFDAARRVAFVGVPGNEHRDSSAVGESFQFKVGDATGDGGPDVLVAFETGGSGDAPTGSCCQRIVEPSVASFRARHATAGSRSTTD